MSRLDMKLQFANCTCNSISHACSGFTAPTTPNRMLSACYDSPNWLQAVCCACMAIITAGAVTEQEGLFGRDWVRRIGLWSGRCKS